MLWIKLQKKQIKYSWSYHQEVVTTDISSSTSCNQTFQITARGFAHLLTNMKKPEETRQLWQVIHFTSWYVKSFPRKNKQKKVAVLEENCYLLRHRFTLEKHFLSWVKSTAFPEPGLHTRAISLRQEGYRSQFFFLEPIL